MFTGSSWRSLTLAALIASLMAVPAAGRAQDAGGVCGDSSSPSAEVEIDTFPRLDLELARTPQEREVGLMDRDYLPPDSGMLFVYQAPALEAYWMYHTLIPLSIAWLDRDGTILNIQDMPRLNDPFNVREAESNVYSPGLAYWYALEVNQGWFFDHGVGVGQQILLCLGS